MPIWIKICGNTSLEDALLAAEAGADAVGFVFAPSPRRVTLDQAAGIVARLPETLEKIGVFVDAAGDEIEAAVRACGLTGVQLHFDAGVEVPARLRARLGAGLRILRVVHFDEGARERAAGYGSDPHVDCLLVDTRTDSAMGGTGIAFDWGAARALFEGAARKPMIAAGGLNAGNVAAAIALLRPWGVDVVSGVEAAPGRKDAEKVRAFVARARAAEREL